MAIQTLIEMRKAICDLQEKVKLIEEFLLTDLQVEEYDQQELLVDGNVTVEAPAPADNYDELLRQRVEAYVARRIHGWKYAKLTSDGSWTAPLTSSEIARGLGEPEIWPQVRRLIKMPGWKSVSWYSSPPPTGWKDGSNKSRWVQWVLLRNEV